MHTHTHTHTHTRMHTHTHTHTRTHAHTHTQIWDVAMGTQLAHRHTGSDYWMIDVAFSPDGKKVVTLCDSIEVCETTFGMVFVTYP